MPTSSTRNIAACRILRKHYHFTRWATMKITASRGIWQNKMAGKTSQYTAMRISMRNMGANLALFAFRRCKSQGHEIKDSNGKCYLWIKFIGNEYLKIGVSPSKVFDSGTVPSPAAPEFFEFVGIWRDFEKDRRRGRNKRRRGLKTARLHRETRGLRGRILRGHGMRKDGSRVLPSL